MLALTNGTGLSRVQKVDHFDPLNKLTYQQKFIVTDDNYVPGGPIFRALPSIRVSKGKAS